MPGPRPSGRQSSAVHLRGASRTPPPTEPPGRFVGAAYMRPAAFWQSAVCRTHPAERSRPLPTKHPLSSSC